MATTALGTALGNLRRTLLRREEAGLTDAELLECFVTRRDEAAFEALVRRHGPMVLGVCRRVLRNEADAEDAFQATYLVLVRKAATIRPRGMVGNWLYGVAHSTALKARAMSSKRFTREREAATRDAARVTPADSAETSQHMQALLDQELKALPDIYRAAIVLCDLEGKTLRDAARQLDCPLATVGTRLARGRSMLSRRLSRHGPVLAGTSVAALIGNQVSAASVSPLLVNTTVQAATLIAAGQGASGVISAKVAALTEGVLKAMLVNKLKVTAAFLVVVGALAMGGNALVQRAPADDTTPVTAATAENDFLRYAIEEQAVAQQRQRPQAKGGVTVTGKLEAVDAEKNSVTLATFKRGEGKTEKTYSVAKDARIVRDGNEAKLADLKQGSQATLKLSEDQKTVVGINAGTQPTSAPLKAVDASKNTITVTVGNRVAKEDKTYQVLKDAKIMIDGKEGKLADLKVGAPIQFIVGEGNTVSLVKTQARRDRKQDE